MYRRAIGSIYHFGIIFLISLSQNQLFQNRALCSINEDRIKVKHTMSQLNGRLGKPVCDIVKSNNFRAERPMSPQYDVLILHNEKTEAQRD